MFPPNIDPPVFVEPAFVAEPNRNPPEPAAPNGLVSSGLVVLLKAAVNENVAFAGLSVTAEVGAKAVELAPPKLENILSFIFAASALVLAGDKVLSFNNVLLAVILLIVKSGSSITCN